MATRLARVPVTTTPERVTLIPGLVAHMRVWARRAATRSALRRELARLDARLLRDAGIDPIDAHREANKPFWRP